MNSPENAAWGILEWAIAGLASIGASAAAFVWRLMTRLHTHERTLPLAECYGKCNIAKEMEGKGP